MSRQTACRLLMTLLATTMLSGVLACASPSDRAQIDAQRREIENFKRQMADQQGQMASQRSQELARQQAVDASRARYREAIETVSRRVAEDMASLQSRSSDATPQQSRAALGVLHELLLEVDVSACPDDFRAQYRRVVGAAREMSDAVNTVPADGFEYFLYVLGQSNTSTVDVSATQPMRAAKEKYERMMFALQELDAISRTYGVDIGK